MLEPIKRLPTTIQFLTLLTITGNYAAADVDQTSGCQPDTENNQTQIDITTQDIFDSDDPDFRWFHRLANDFHVNTKERVIRRQLPQRIEEQANRKTIEESQRLIRSLPYIYDADVEASCEAGVKKVKVTTRDRWTLLPNLSLSRAGGKSNSTVGISDDNLFGLGIHAGVSYIDNTQRTGVSVNWNAPIPSIQHASFSGALADNDDGHLIRLAFNRPFYELDGKSSILAVGHTEERDDTQFQNGFTSNVYEHGIEFASLAYGWSSGLNAQSVLRWTAGVTIDHHNFDSSPDRFTRAVPNDREFTYPWLGVQYIEDHYINIANVDLVTEVEDIHLGWQHSASLGVEANDVRSGTTVGSHIRWSSSKNWHAQSHLLRLSLGGNGSFGTTAEDNYRLSGQLEVFYRLSDVVTIYNRSQYAQVNNNYIDRPLTLGGVSGVRGFPFQYQHGDRLWANSLELRYYPGKSYYQMFNLAWMAFVDAGQARGNGLLLNENEDTLSSVGIGMRIYAPRFSGRNVIHVNLARPLEDGAEVPDWEFQVQVRRTF